MEFKSRILCFVMLLLVCVHDAAAQGFHWSYQTRITQSYDSAPGQKAPAAPAPKFVPYPVYPWEMVRARIEGAVTLQFRVTADGLVEEISVIKATQREFSESAVEAVRSWRFLPLKKNGPSYPSSVVVLSTFKFEVPEE